MAKVERPKERTVSGLRTRFFPKSRIGQGLVTVAPWVDVVILIVLFTMLDTKFVLQPGHRIALPRGPIRSGARARPGFTAVVLSIESGDSVTRKEVVHFDDERFLVAEQEDMKRLLKALGRRSRRHRDAPLTIQADERVRHGTIVRLLDMAKDLNIREVNIASRAE
jgi:biopolymer transport protein ExbD